MANMTVTQLQRALCISRSAIPSLQIDFYLVPTLKAFAFT